MTSHSHNTALCLTALTALLMAAGCDQPLDDGLDPIERSDEVDELDEVDGPDDLSTEDGDALETDEDGRPLSPEVRTLYSSPNEVLLEEQSEQAPEATLEDFGHAIGIGPDDIPVNADALALDDDPLAVFGLRWSGIHSFGGDFFGKSYDIIRGPSNCRAGHTRAFAHAYVEGSGSCYVSGWYTFDPTDCRVRVRVNQPGWFAGGQCRMFVYDQ